MILPFCTQPVITEFQDATSLPSCRHSNTRSAESSMPHLAYIPMSALATRVLLSSPLFTASPCTSSPQRPSPSTPHALSTDANVHPSGATPGAADARMAR
uniref:Uncharacterized protein n=1 Tax=Arundo donax TaxID=35708 RepID=A0A0A9G1Y3_ARUDO